MTQTFIEAALYLSRSAALSIVAKTTILLLFGLGASSLAGRRPASVRHLLLAGTFAALVALPILVVAGPSLPIELAVAHAASPTPLVAAAAVETPSSPANLAALAPEARPQAWSWPVTITFVWAAGAVVLLGQLLLNLWSLRRLRRHGLPWPEFHSRVQSFAAERGIRRPIDILLHEDIPAPLTCGVWRPAILLPIDARRWPEDDLRRALIHELEHVRRSDSLVQLMARAICACYWFHPLVWMAWRRLCLEAERACDDAVIQTADRADYAMQLVSLARRMSTAQTQPALGMANRSDLSRRVSAVLDGGQRRGRAGALPAAAALIGALLAVLALAPVQAVAQAPSTLNRALYEAAEQGEVAQIGDLLNAGASVNCVLAGDGSPLIGAARKGRLQAVRFLLERGADPNMPVRGDGNPLIMAARQGHVEVVALLLDRGANINQSVPDDENALIQASSRGRLDVVKLLVARGADVNSRIWVEQARGPNGEWRSPLSMARAGRYDAVVAYLLSVGAVL